ncbi:putative ribosomal protein RPS14 [Besnoitia besnoiti]|uniref:Putative ribosomal protein RPS14 n=1 Tax=Besnoitia besnoiti TaxID=94643 RepID=A0A2A9MBW4_BESBE|nr:putative ribosomal protein RPS14 [Besnoitia besnoiti]PFH34714.1 putative ribosomal protein RPS14 [Besnoitia besnoiti]
MLYPPWASALADWAWLGRCSSRPVSFSCFSVCDLFSVATDNLLVGLRDAQVQRNLRRKQMIMDYKPLRQYYKHKVAHATSMDERLDWHCRLQRLPRDSSPTRYRNRCRLCGRARGYFRFFGLCRHHVLDMVRNVMLPGFTKAEW